MQCILLSTSVLPIPKKPDDTFDPQIDKTHGALLILIKQNLPPHMRRVEVIASDGKKQIDYFKAHRYNDADRVAVIFPHLAFGTYKVFVHPDFIKYMLEKEFQEIPHDITVEIVPEELGLIVWSI